jgi:hypothetical protein
MGFELRVWKGGSVELEAVFLEKEHRNRGLPEAIRSRGFSTMIVRGTSSAPSRRNWCGGKNNLRKSGVQMMISRESIRNNASVRLSTIQRIRRAGALDSIQKEVFEAAYFIAKVKDTSLRLMFLDRVPNLLRA